MQVTVEGINSVKKKLFIEITEDNVISELENAYNDLKKTAKIKGFRPGKAPLNVLKRLFKKDVHADVSSKLLQSSLIDALKKTELNIVGNPIIDPPEFQEKGPYKYEATVEIRPEIEDVEYHGLTLKKTVYKVSDNEIDMQLKMLQKNMAAQTAIDEDRPAQEGDFALIDFEGFKDGKPIDAAKKTENFTIKIGDGHILEAFDQNIIGMTAGASKEFTVNFPADYFNKELVGLEILFHLTLQEIREEVLPEIDDKLAKKLGQYTTLDELKQSIKDHMSMSYAKRSEQEIQEQVYEALITKNDFEVPDAMVDYELEGIVQEAERAYAYQNMSLEQMGLSREDLAKKYRDIAVNQVKRHLILSKIVEQENMSLSDEDLEKGYQEMADTYKQPVEKLKEHYGQNNEKLELFKHVLLEKHALKLIIDRSDIEEVEPAAMPEPKQEDPANR